MGRRGERLDVGFFCKGRMPWTRDAGETFPKQRACEDARRGVDRNADCKTYLATVAEADDFIFAKNAADLHIEARRFDREPRQERGEQHERSVVGHRDRDDVIGSRWIEAIVLQD